MTLLSRTTARRHAAASSLGRRLSEASGLRVEEIGAVTDIEPTYRAVDSAGDLEMASWFKRHYAAQTTEDGREDVAAGFAILQRTERREELAVTTSVEDAADTLRANNPFWLSDGCGPDGRAA
jgi:hypothetical protein